VLAPNATLRAALVPGPARNTSGPSDQHAHGAPARMGWARFLERVFDIDLEHCPQCGGAFRIIAAIEEPAVIVKILTHLGLPARAPTRAPRALVCRESACVEMRQFESIQQSNRHRQRGNFAKQLTMDRAGLLLHFFSARRYRRASGKGGLNFLYARPPTARA